LKEIFSLLSIIEAKIKNTEYFRKLKYQNESKYVKNCYLTKRDFMDIEFWFEKDLRVNPRNCKS